jgi:hypothetical protein
MHSVRLMSMPDAAVAWSCRFFLGLSAGYDCALETTAVLEQGAGEGLLRRHALEKTHLSAAASPLLSYNL